MKIIRRTWDDIKRGENVDLYLTVVFAVVVATLNLIGIAPQYLNSLISAVLALLVFAALGNRQRLEDLIRKIGEDEKSIFQVDLLENQQSELDLAIERAEDLLIIGTSLGKSLERHYALFEPKIRNGQTIRIVLENPYSSACDMAVKRRSYFLSADDWRNQVLSTLKSLIDLQKKAPGNFEIRVIDFHFSYGAILADANTSTGICFAWHYSFKTRRGNIPKYFLRPEKGFIYLHFVEEANAIWNNSRSWQDIDLLRNLN